MRNGHSLGICSIMAKLLKVSGVSLTHWLVHIINEQFWKHMGSKLICSNHKTITLLLIPGQLLTCILLTWTLPAICHKHKPQQASFMSNHWTINHTSAVWLIVEKQWEFCNDQHQYITFVDLKAALDSVDHNALWTILRTISVPKKITLFPKLYDQT